MKSSLILSALSLTTPALAFPILEERQSGSAAAYCTNAALTLKLSPITAPVRGAGSPPSGAQQWQLAIDDTAAGYKQKITGFGAAVTDGTVINLNRLSSQRQDAVLNDFFSSSGARFSLMRHTIGASDLTRATAVTYNDNGGKPDPELKNFALGTNGTNMANLIKKMKAKNSALLNVGSPWSPPGWMKRNGVLYGQTDNNNLQDTYLDSTETNYAGPWANYFVKYIQAFANLGVSVDSITPQNEPLYSASTYPTMYMFDYEQALLIKNFLAPALTKAKLNTTIWAYDHNTDVPSYPQTVLDVAGDYTNTVAWHCYAGNLDWSALTEFRNNNPGVMQYMTECWTPAADQYNWHQASNFTIGPLQNWASGVISWNLGADQNNGPFLPGSCSGCRGLVTVNSDGTYTLNISAYLIAQYSKWMLRGATVLAGTGSSTRGDTYGIQHVATLNADKTRTVVIQNTFTNDVYVSLNATSGARWSGNIPASSVVTWVLPSS